MTVGVSQQQGSEETERMEKPRSSLSRVTANDTLMLQAWSGRGRVEAREKRVEWGRGCGLRDKPHCQHADDFCTFFFHCGFSSCSIAVNCVREGRRGRGGRMKESSSGVRVRIS